MRNIVALIFDAPLLDYDYGKRNLHLGWIKHHEPAGHDKELQMVVWCVYRKWKINRLEVQTGI